MELADAARVAAHLKAAYPRMTLEEEEGELFLREIARLPDATTALAAADRIIRTSERFPTVAEFRAQYRAVEPRTAARALDEPGRRDEIPEWVQVWRWHTNRTLTERQAARPGVRPVAERAPVKVRDFPQFEHPGPDAYSMAEYEEIRGEWVAAGSPTMGVEGLVTV